MSFKHFLVRRLGLWAGFFLFVAQPAVGRAATYYVDPATGSNSNNGTSAATPWLNPPGTRQAADRGFWSSTWGAVSTSNKIQCGDVILLKGGATQTSAQGGAWRIDPSYYTTGCTANARITLRVATGTEWPNSAGSFTLDGTKITPTADRYFGFTDHTALINVEGPIDFVELKGASDSQRLTVVDSTAWSIMVACNVFTASNNCPRQGFRGDWLDIHNSVDGFNIGQWSDWQVSNSIAYNIQHGPWQTGVNNDHYVNQGGFVNMLAHDSGCGSSAAPSCSRSAGREDLFFFVGGLNVWCENCTAYGGGERGFNSGVIQNSSMPSDFHYHYRDIVSHDNGATCNRTGHGHICFGVGIGVSGNNNSNPYVSRNYVMGAELFHNAMGGGLAYGWGNLELWHATTYNTGYKFTYSGSMILDDTANGILEANSIDTLESTTQDQAFTWNNAGGTSPMRTYTPIMGNNCFQPRASDSEVLGTDDGTGWPGKGTYAAPPTWIGASNDAGLIGCNPNFASLDPTVWASNNFTLQSGSSAIDTGRFVLKAAGAGNASSLITVTANGIGSGDPRNYFVEPGTFLDASADSIQIEGCGVVTVTGMTANTISFAPPCSWADGAGVHLPWTGAAPDMGAVESQ